MPPRPFAALAISGLLAGSLLGLSQTPALAAPAAAPTVLYASPTGAAGAGAACTLAAPCSLPAAETRVRTLAPSMAADIDVDLLGGTYRVTGPLRFGPQDSGQNGHTVVYQAYPGQVPVISGASKVNGFALYDAGKGIYRAAVPAGTQSRQLFVNGVRAQRARSALNPDGFTLSGSSFTTSDASYTSFTHQSQVEIVNDNDWKQMRCPLSSITALSGGGSSLNIDPACFANNNTSVPNLQYPFNGAGLPKLTGLSWIENAYQLLTQPGQFYLDSTAGYVYYIHPAPRRAVVDRGRRTAHRAGAAGPVRHPGPPGAGQ
ncbi:hypothetical protein [Streptacidiphilus sp. PAMC 29251]